MLERCPCVKWRPPPKLQLSANQILNTPWPQSRSFYSPCQYQVYLRWLNATSCILLPSNYATGDSKTAGKMLEWPWPADASLVQKTCIAHQRMGEHPRILKYLRREEWSGFLILERPTGPQLNGFLKEHESLLYPEGNDAIKLTERFRPLATMWALQLLSTIKFIHAHDVVGGGFDSNSIFLTADLDVKLVGFMDAYVVGDCTIEGLAERRQKAVIGDLFDWARLYEALMLKCPEEGFGSWDVPGAKVIKKCRHGQFLSIEQAWRAFVADLEERGFVIEGDCLKGFDPLDVLRSESLPGKRDGREFDSKGGPMTDIPLNVGAIELHVAHHAVADEDWVVISKKVEPPE